MAERRIGVFRFFLVFLVLGALFPFESIAQTKLFRIKTFRVYGYKNVPLEEEGRENSTLIGVYDVKTPKNSMISLRGNRHFRLFDPISNKVIRMHTREFRSDINGFTRVLMRPHKDNDSLLVVDPGGIVLSAAYHDYKNQRTIVLLEQGQGAFRMLVFDDRKTLPDAAEVAVESTSDSGGASDSEKRKLSHASVNAAANFPVDLAVLYTDEAAGNISNLKSLIDLEVARTNNAFRNSGIRAQIRLVAFKALTFSERSYGSSPRIDAILEDLVGGGNSRLVNHFYLRDSYGADLVSVISNTSLCRNGKSVGGIAYRLGSMNPDPSRAYAVIPRSSLGTGEYVLAHELGHNFGAAHASNDRDSVSGNLPTSMTEYGYGYRFEGEDGNTYRTIMAYSPGTMIPYFSNPHILYDFRNAGSASSDNARLINETASIVASYRNPGCIPNDPSIDFDSSQVSGADDERPTLSIRSAFSKSWRVTVKNNDWWGCSTPSFRIYHNIPSSWRPSFESGSVITVSPQSSRSIILGVKIPKTQKEVRRRFRIVARKTVLSSLDNTPHTDAGHRDFYIAVDNTPPPAPIGMGFMRAVDGPGSMGIRLMPDSSSEEISMFQMFLDGRAADVVSYPMTGGFYLFRGLVPGRYYNFQAIVYDFAGNKSNLSGTWCVEAK